ncbi:hypothetical protein H206_05356 [Candidatus Electrothrix aarhusensis]|uniref:Uncharacterized protein n=1 Tax=Candidatus Electrothrix aarhusensis TaxID=1859131 RepID=A0A444J4P2_9BACT|nr:hypothetical protein H206_05356 [Candidatus Electrothrix aarhusensis]
MPSRSRKRFMESRPSLILKNWSLSRNSHASW